VVSGTGVIFDFDGTLVDTLPDLTDAVNVGLQALGFVPRPMSDVRGWVGEGLPVLCRRAVGNAPDVPIEEMAAIVTAHYRKNRLAKTAPFPGVVELLDALTERRVPMAILSNKPAEHMLPMTQALFGCWRFVAVEGYRQEERRKPDPRTALEIVARMRLEPSQVLAVGDSTTDVATAVNTGLVPVGVTWGYRSRQQLLDAGARHLVDRPAELLPLIDAMIGR